MSSKYNFIDKEGVYLNIHDQRLNYLHYNPVTAGFVTEPFHWKYSSADEYYNNIKGRLELNILD